MISPHGVYSDSNALRQERLSLTFVALFLLLGHGDHELAFIKAAPGANPMRNMGRSTLRAFGEAGKFQAFPVRAS